MRSNGGGRERNDCGFTLLELSISIILFGIAAAVVAPLAGGSNAVVAGVATEMEHLTTQAQFYAAVEGTTVRVALNLATGEYVIARAGDGEADMTTLQEGWIPELAALVRSDGGGSTAVLRFSPFGEVDAPSFMLSPGPLGRIRLSLSPWTGRVRLESL